RTIEREGGPVFPLVRQRLLPLRVCPVSRHLSGSSEDGESPSEDGQSHSAESTASLCEHYWKRRRVSVPFSQAAPAPFESAPGVQALVRQLRGWGESFRGWPKSFS